MNRSARGRPKPRAGQSGDEKRNRARGNVNLPLSVKCPLGDAELRRNVRLATLRTTPADKPPRAAVESRRLAEADTHRGDGGSGSFLQESLA
jgi:hypothetical protein